MIQLIELQKILNVRNKVDMPDNPTTMRDPKHMEYAMETIREYIAATGFMETERQDIVCDNGLIPCLSQAVESLADLQLWVLQTASEMGLFKGQPTCRVPDHAVGYKDMEARFGEYTVFEEAVNRTLLKRNGVKQDITFIKELTDEQPLV